MNVVFFLSHFQLIAQIKKRFLLYLNKNKEEMNNGDLNLFSIEKLRKHLGIPTEFADEFIITDMVHPVNENLFKYPCKLDAYVVALCLEGEAVASVNLNEIRIRPNLLMVNCPENIIQVKEGLRCCNGYIMIIGEKFLKNLHIDLANLFPMFLEVKNHPAFLLSDEEKEILVEYYRIISESTAATDDHYHKEIVRQLISAFIYKACSLLYKRENCEIALPSAPKGRREQLFSRFMELLSQYHRKERSVGFYASELSITPKYLSTLIKQISGKTAAEWIDEYVILEAKALLKYSDKSIQEIAYHLNFPTQSFFGKYFKHHTGMSPSNYKAFGL